MSLLSFFFLVSDSDRPALITAIWLFGVGALLGLLVVTLVWGVMKLILPRQADKCTRALTGPVLMPIGIVTGLWAFIGLVLPLVAMLMGPTGVGTGLFAVAPQEIFTSLQQIRTAGTTTTNHVVPTPTEGVDDAGNLPATRLDRPSWSTDQMRGLTVTSSGRMELVVRVAGETEDVVTYDVRGGQDFNWRREDRGTLLRRIPAGETVELLARNPTNSDLEVQVVLELEPIHREASSVFMVGGMVAFVFLSYFLMATVFPKITAIAEATATSEIYQLLFIICTLIGCVFMIIAIYLPYQTFGEDIKVLKHTGLQISLVLGIVVAVWAASNSIAEEIEGKTALTLLSKPVSRRQFVLGKFAGIGWTVCVMFVIIGSFFILSVAHKPIFDAREGTEQVYDGEKGVTWQLLHSEAVSVLPGVLLVFMETLVLAGVSVAISTRLPLVANFLITFGVWGLGHLTPSIMQASVEGFEPVQFVAGLLATIMPGLENYEIYGAISAGREIPLIYLGGAALYTVLYGTLTILLALILFEDRDLA